MVRALLIAEKPSLMRDIEKVYKKMNSSIQIDFASFVGHVVELKEPHEYKVEWKKWEISLLPMLPERYEFRVKKEASKVYKEIEQKIKIGNYDFLINACDAGMEGENIFYSFYKKANCKLPVKRFWTSQTTDQAIKDALNHLLDENDEEIRNLRNAAMYRMIFDWLIGLNLTRAATIKGGRTIKVGRVMTPTLAIVVKRELEIRNFQPTPYFQLELDFGNFKALWFDNQSKENKIASRDHAENLQAKLVNPCKIIDVKTERKSIDAPQLHSLLELQKEANKFYGFTSQQTLKIAQSLYEKHKLITYPRTESRHLPTDFAKSIEQQLKVIGTIPEYSQIVEKIMADHSKVQAFWKNKKYVDDKKLTDHHAITITNQKIGKKNLTDSELKIYHLIVKRLLAVMMPPYVIDKTQSIIQSFDEHFKATGQIVIQKGFTELYEKFSKKSEKSLPILTVGQEIPYINSTILAKETEPPARYTDSTLLDAMFHAGRFVDNKELKEYLKDAEGIGTSATRAEIIEKLITIGMMERQGKSITATNFGIDVIMSLKQHDVVSPGLTAIWSKKLKDIADGKLPSKQFYEQLIRYVMETTAQMKNIDIGVAPKERIIVGKCPSCQNQVIENWKFYSCENTNCQFKLSKTMLKGKITVNDAKKLLAGKETREIFFTWKSGKRGKARLKLEGTKPIFIFPSNN